MFGTVWNCTVRKEIMSSLYIAECDGSGIVELLVNKVKELVTTGITCSTVITILF